MLNLKFDEQGYAVARFDHTIHLLQAGESIRLHLPDNGICIHDAQFDSQTVDACIAAVYEKFNDMELAILKVTRCAQLADIIKINLIHAKAYMLYNKRDANFVIAKPSHNNIDLELVEDYQEITSQTQLLEMEIEDYLAQINGKEMSKYFAQRHFGQQTRKSNKYFCAKYSDKQVRVFKKQSDYHVFLSHYYRGDDCALAYRHFSAADFKAFVAQCYKNQASEAMATYRAVAILNPMEQRV